MYTKENMQDDLKAAARALHLAYRRATFARQRWYGGASADFDFGADQPYFGVMNRIDEMVADMEANNNAKLNTVLAVSDLALPGD